jgi:hypothetical protein
MGENYGFCGVVPAKYSLHGCCWQNIDSVRLASVLLKVQRRNKGKYGDSGFARMTTSAAAYSVEKERFKRAAEVYFRTIEAAPRWI